MFRWSSRIALLSIPILLAQPAHAAGPTFSGTSTVGVQDVVMAGVDSSPQVATDGANNWVVVWHSTDVLAGGVGGDAEILVATSTNNAVSFGAAAALNSTATTDENAAPNQRQDIEPEIATNGNGRWITVWNTFRRNLAGVGNDSDIMFAISDNNGGTWTAAAALNTNAVDDIGDDGATAIDADGAGNWAVVWRTTSDFAGNGTEGDIAFARSTNNGATWSAPVLLHADGVGDTVNDTVPEVHSDRRGNWFVIWQREIDGSTSNIMETRSTDSGATWSTPRTVNGTSGRNILGQIASSPDGALITAWQTTDTFNGMSQGDFEIVAARGSTTSTVWSAPVIVNEDAFTDVGSGDQRPALATDGAGNWVLLWDHTASGDIDVNISSSTNNGMTWTARAPLVSDSTNDTQAVLAPDGRGRWVAAWRNGAANTPVVYAIGAHLCGDLDRDPGEGCDAVGCCNVDCTVATGCCFENNDCEDGMACTANTCNLQLNQCNMSTVIQDCCTQDSQCNDSNVCTTDSCVISTGECAASEIDNCCLDDNGCDDSNVCTTDTCVSNACSFTMITGCGPDGGVVASPDASEGTPIADAGTATTPEVEDEGCSCSTSHTARGASWTVLLLGLALMSRRRRK